VIAERPLETTGAMRALRTLPHAPPDRSDGQAFVYTEYPGQTLTSAMQTVPRAKVVRGFSFFGVSRRRGNIVPEANDQLRATFLYRPTIARVLKAKAAPIAPACDLGGEFMPPLDECALLNMPPTLPGLSVTDAAELLHTRDRIIKSLAEVSSPLRQGRPRRDGD
jgi:hypothetical protein